MYQTDETTSEVGLRATGIIHSLFDPEISGDSISPAVFTKWTTGRNCLSHRGQRVDRFAAVDPIDPIIGLDDWPVTER